MGREKSRAAGQQQESLQVGVGCTIPGYWHRSGIILRLSPGIVRIIVVVYGLPRLVRDTPPRPGMLGTQRPIRMALVAEPVRSEGYDGFTPKPIS